jgi:hypothetical protein
MTDKRIWEIRRIVAELYVERFHFRPVQILAEIIQELLAEREQNKPTEESQP